MELSKLDKFTIRERVTGNLYFVFFNRVGYKTQALGYTKTEAGAVRKVKAFAKNNAVANFMTVYTKQKGTAQ